ncbi:MAG: agmatinase [Anaerolineae bacterium]|jgi:agmatinase
MAQSLWSGLSGEDPRSEVGVLGVSFDGGASYRRGAALAPAKLRELSVHLACCADEGQPLRLRVRDYGDVPRDPDWGRCFEAVRRRATEALQHPMATFLGGDHSVTIPLMQALDQSVDGPVGVVYFDAHPDLFDVYDGRRWSHACTGRRILEVPGVDEARLVFVGLRSIARDEWDFLQEHREIATYSARECYRRGMEAIAENIVERLSDVPVAYLTLDIDGLDPAYAPGTGYAEGGGLSTRELLELVRTVCRDLPVRGMDVVEVAPPLDHSDITSFAALKVIYEAWWGTQQRLLGGSGSGAVRRCAPLVTSASKLGEMDDG